ncbi:MAG TPA: endolytic transglycosylase MltG [Gammaproteobacteria bacterium]|nr:endolytic transglycosylase MltG [Gammaproteobacteria bacterium]
MSKRLGIAGVIAAVLVCAAAIGAYSAWRTLDAPLALPSGAGATLFDVPSGSSLKKVGAELARRGILDHPRILTWYARLGGKARHIHAGEYELEPGLTPRGLLEKLVAGRVYLHQFTIVEGWRFDELLHALRAQPAIASTTLDGSGIMAELGEPDVPPEGQFFPDTYKFPRGTSDVDFLRRAHEAMRKRLADAWAARDSGISISTPYEALILASIVEKESALAAERRKIAGVFNARLARGMRLQTDPTVIYGLGSAFDGDLRSSDLVKDTPYNTYTRTGLPPTPIALPSEESIEAVVHPDTSGALYFVATGLPDGSHYFSTTLEEHNAAVRRYLERVRAAAAAH